MKTETPCTCSSTSCDDRLAERPRYFPRQLITPDDMTLEQEYFRNRMRRHNRLLHGWGVVCGALVCPVLKSNGTSVGVPWKVVVQPGYILGPYGDEVIIDCNVCFDLRKRCVTGVTGEACGETVDPWCSDVYVQPKSKDGKLYVAVRYKQVMSRPVRVQPVGCGCDDNQCEYSRWRDGYEICVLDKCPESHPDALPDLDKIGEGPVPACPPCPDEPWVVLAKVEVNEQGIVQRIDNCDCRRLVVSLGKQWWRCTATLPEITAVNPDKLEVGKTSTLTITGKNLDANAEVSLGSGVTVKVDSWKEKGPGLQELSATAAVNAHVPLGPLNLVVKNPDCSTATFLGNVQVVSPAAPYTYEVMTVEKAGKKRVKTKR